MRMRLWKTAMLAVAGIGVAGAAQAGKDDDTLTWVTTYEPPTYNYYDQTLREGTILSRHIWDSLYWRDLDTGEYVPHLATKIEYADPKTIDITLRQGVTFHNGEKFDADDVVFTINMVNDPDNKMANRNPVRWISSVEKTGEYSVRLHLDKVFAPAIEYLSTSIVMYPDQYYQKVGKDGYGRAPVGTGPYKAASVEPGKRLVLEKNEKYFGGGKGQPHIGTVVMRFIPETNTQIAELLAGNADLIWRLSKEQGEKLGRMPNVDVVAGETMRVGYLQFDAAGKSGDTPVTNQKVRQAISYAIDREAIVKNLMGAGTVQDLACYPSQFGCESPDAPRYAYDPAKAKALLTEAGYPDGFSIDFYGYRDRPVAEAMMGFLSKVGIKANLQWMKYSALRDKVRNDEVPFDFMTWGSGSVNDIANITAYFFDGRSDDTALDPQVKALLDAGGATIDPAERKKNYAEALRIIAEQAYWLPLWSYAYFYGMNPELDFQPTPDEIVHLYRAKWK
ncbi:MAG: ABC transporter substrate-binding protein [Alphaproteobacteria bacterium]|nr:ABC transporter substrate-binding protein [Alphaproteobacteria bacterium]MCB9931712.1 ABC transporter substrate-binding protein [Alphaproteobacteria bacterium]